MNEPYSINFEYIFDLLNEDFKKQYLELAKKGTVYFKLGDNGEIVLIDPNDNRKEKE